MDIPRLFLSFEGRINRAQWWIGNVMVTVVHSAIHWLLGIPLMSEPAELRLRVVSFAVSLVLSYPLAALAVKRLHDRNQPARNAIVLGAAYLAGLVGDLAGYFDNSAPLTVAVGIALAVIGVIFLAYLIELGFRRGTAGSNAYGPDPAQRAA